MNQKSMDNQSGSIIGGALGFINGTILYIASVGVTQEAVTSTIILAAIGAVVGFLVTQLTKFIYRKIFKKHD